jgi:haloacetate dehalogenase
MIDPIAWDDFDTMNVDTDEVTLFLRRAGSGPPLLLLHGFPETHLMWRFVAPRLASDFTVICPDLRGYGQSGCPPSAPDHSPYAKRAMARDMVSLMAGLGHERFSVAGHDRGGRVAYRLALDHPERIERLALLDIIATSDAWDRADMRLTLAFWPWSLLAQPEPLPERLLSAAPDAVVDDALAGWGSPPSTFAPDIRAAYADALRDPVHVHAICEEYRAAASVDREHDLEDRRNGRRIRCPLLVLWSSSGALGGWYADEGGPLALWRRWAEDVRGRPIDGGHFFPEDRPEETAKILGEFFSPRLAQS